MLPLALSVLLPDEAHGGNSEARHREKRKEKGTHTPPPKPPPYAFPVAGGSMGQGYVALKCG
jgi:hypothetical protein